MKLWKGFIKKQKRWHGSLWKQTRDKYGWNKKALLFGLFFFFSFPKCLGHLESQTEQESGSWWECGQDWLIENSLSWNEPISASVKLLHQRLSQGHGLVLSRGNRTCFLHMPLCAQGANATSSPLQGWVRRCNTKWGIMFPPKHNSHLSYIKATLDWIQLQSLDSHSPSSP